MKPILAVFFALFSWFFLAAQPVWAEGEFRADYDVHYAIPPNGITIVTQNVKLTNQKPNLYPKQYSITIDSTNIKNVIAYDNRGVISPGIIQADGKTTIVLLFNDQVVGLGKQLKFTLRYENGDTAKKIGSIWEVNIPGITPDPDLGDYNVSLQVPPTFGPNAYLTPPPQQGQKWTRQQMLQGGISAAYGSEQNFRTQLAYYLENPGLTIREGEIALPPDTALQKVSIESLLPKPANVTRDQDGNWLAKYQLTPGQKLEIKASLLISVSLNPRPEYSQETPVDSYLVADEYWETGDERITKLAQTLKTPRSIYNYVVNNLTYDYTRVKQNPIRKGAVQTLAYPKNSICMEFTDLFIALARAAGIPAREVVGYAHTTNPKLRPLSLISDVLHAWPEYYDAQKSTWIPVDPTWGNTTGGINYFDKLDFNHIAFVIHGQSSTHPYAAGSYRKSGKIGRDVSVEFADTSPAKSEAKAEVSFNFPPVVTGGQTVQGEAIITNVSKQTFENLTAIMTASPFPYSLTEKSIKLPPGGHISLPIKLVAGSFITRGSGRITVTVNDQVFNHNFIVEPMYWIFIPISLLTVIIAILIIYIAIKPKLWKKSKKS